MTQCVIPTKLCVCHTDSIINAIAKFDISLMPEGRVVLLIVINLINPHTKSDMPKTDRFMHLDAPHNV